MRKGKWVKKIENIDDIVLEALEGINEDINFGIKSLKEKKRAANITREIVGHEYFLGKTYTDEEINSIGTEIKYNGQRYYFSSIITLSLITELSSLDGLTTDVNKYVGNVCTVCEYKNNKYNFELTRRMKGDIAFMKPGEKPEIDYAIVTIRSEEIDLDVDKFMEFADNVKNLFGGEFEQKKDPISKMHGDYIYGYRLYDRKAVPVNIEATLVHVPTKENKGLLFNKEMLEKIGCCDNIELCFHDIPVIVYREVYKKINPKIIRYIDTKNVGDISGHIFNICYEDKTLEPLQDQVHNKIGHIIAKES